MCVFSEYILLSAQGKRWHQIDLLTNVHSWQQIDIVYNVSEERFPGIIDCICKK